MLPEAVITWLWSTPGYRTKFTAHHVNVMRAMIARHYKHPHRFICITDMPEGLDPRVEVYPLGDLYRNLKNPTWPREGPNCFPRLRAFSKEFEQIAGKRFVSIDIDCVITGDLAPLFDRPEDFVVWAPVRARSHYNGSLWMMTAGSRSQVWDDFDPLTSPATANAAGCSGSDQGWIMYKLGPNEAKWTHEHGVHGFKHLRKHGKGAPLVAGSKVVVFHGRPDPWDATAEAPWINEHWRM